MRTRLIALGLGIGSLSAVASAFVLVGLPFGADGTTIQGCYSSGGALKVLTPSEPSCPKGYTPISWGVTGPAGPQGPQGLQGIPGPQGAAGPQGRQAPARCMSGRIHMSSRRHMTRSHSRSLR